MTQIGEFKAFLNQRLMAAAEEIFWEVEKTITAYQEEIYRSKQENDYLRRQLTELPERADASQVTATAEEETTVASHNNIKEEDAWTNFEDDQELDPDTKEFKPSPCFSSMDGGSEDPIFPLSVVLRDNVEELVLPQRPDTVDDLKVMLKDILQLNFEFVLHYQDPDFDHQYFSLHTIEELPPGVLVKVVKTQAFPSISWTDETSRMPPLDVQIDAQRGQSHWPERFVIPNFSYTVELALGKGNSDFIVNGTSLTVSKEQKMNILSTMAHEICKYNPYPNDIEISDAAEALVKKHPCLRDPGSEMGYQSWKQSLKFKMANYRAKLRKDGVQEFAYSSSVPAETEIHPPCQQNEWPDVFVTPVFSYAVELALQKGNSEFTQSGKTLTLRREHKMNILTRMANEIYKYKAYPNDTEVSRAAEALVKKHPCLRDPGSKGGHQSWKHSLKFKMSNYRAKLRRVGLQEVIMNGGKRK